MDEIMQLILQFIVFPIVVGLSILVAQVGTSWLKNWIYSPKLVITTDDFYPYSTDDVQNEAPTPPYHYYHLILENKGRTMAKNVIIKIEVLDEQGTILDRLSQISLEMRGYDPTNIASHSYEVFDLCYFHSLLPDQINFTSIVGQDSTKRTKARTLQTGVYFINAYIFADNFKNEKPYQFQITRRKGTSIENVQIELISNP